MSDRRPPSQTAGFTNSPVGVARRVRRPKRAPWPIIELLDFAPATADVRAEVVAALSQPRKTLPCKLLYDDRGSKLFEQICQLPEYYPTRTELQIIRDHACKIAAAVGRRCLLVEYGSGSSLKTRVLLDHLNHPVGYVPIDISRGHLIHSSRALAASYPRLRVRPVCADYTAPFHLPAFDMDGPRRPARVVAFFPGSTIGNFEPQQARTFLTSLREVCGPGSGLLIGVDLKKDPAVLHAAYNDAAGVTAAFNLNLIERINRELGAGLDVRAFAHRAFYDPAAGRVEMHLVCDRRQHVDLGLGETISFAEGETIHTENSYKYTVAGFHGLAIEAGFRPVHVWTDPLNWFSLHYLMVECSAGVAERRRIRH